jgi:hypothetical protein
MHEVTSFDSVEEMQAAIRAREDAANERILPSQILLRDDHSNTRFWFRVYDNEVEIWGIAPSLDDLWAQEVRCGAEPDEEQSFRDHEIEMRGRGYVRGTAYSIIVPDGEFGSTHVSEVIPVTEEAFHAARVAEWHGRGEREVIRHMVPILNAIEVEASALATRLALEGRG